MYSRGPGLLLVGNFLIVYSISLVGMYRKERVHMEGVIGEYSQNTLYEILKKLKYYFKNKIEDDMRRCMLTDWQN